MADVLGQQAEIVWVAGEHYRPDSGRDDDHMRVDYVDGSRLAEEGADVVCVLRSERNDVAAAQDSSQRDLAR